MRNTRWIPSIMDVDRVPAEFTGDDVDRFTSLIDLSGNYEFVTVILPIMVSSTVTVYIQRTDQIDEIPSLLHILDADSEASLVQTSPTVELTSLAVTFRIGGAQFFRLYTSADQTSDITFYAKGFNRENM